MEVLPTIRYLIVCEDVQRDEENPRRITLAGLMSAIRSIADELDSFHRRPSISAPSSRALRVCATDRVSW